MEWKTTIREIEGPTYATERRVRRIAEYVISSHAALVDLEVELTKAENGIKDGVLNPVMPSQLDAYLFQLGEVRQRLNEVIDSDRAARDNLAYTQLLDMQQALPSQIKALEHAISEQLGEQVDLDLKPVQGILSSLYRSLCQVDALMDTVNHKLYLYSQLVRRLRAGGYLQREFDLMFDEVSEQGRIVEMLRQTPEMRELSELDRTLPNPTRLKRLFAWAKALWEAKSAGWIHPSDEVGWTQDELRDMVLTIANTEAQRRSLLNEALISFGKETSQRGFDQNRQAEALKIAEKRVSDSIVVNAQDVVELMGLMSELAALVRQVHADRTWAQKAPGALLALPSAMEPSLDGLSPEVVAVLAKLRNMFELVHLDTLQPRKALLETWADKVIALEDRINALDPLLLRLDHQRSALGTWAKPPERHDKDRLALHQSMMVRLRLGQITVADGVRSAQAECAALLSEREPLTLQWGLNHLRYVIEQQQQIVQGHLLAAEGAPETAVFQWWFDRFQLLAELLEQVDRIFISYITQKLLQQDVRIKERMVALQALQV